MKWYHNQFETTPRGIFFLSPAYIGPFARLVASTGDAELFNDIYDVYNSFASNGFYLPDQFCAQDDFLETMLDNEHLFKTIFQEKNYSFDLGPKGPKLCGKQTLDFKCINPVINGLLAHAIKNLEKYKPQAIRILEFGIQHNQALVGRLPDWYHMNDLGGIIRENDIVDIAIEASTDGIKDEAILDLIRRLPVLRRAY